MPLTKNHNPKGCNDDSVLLQRIVKRNLPAAADSPGQTRGQPSARVTHLTLPGAKPMILLLFVPMVGPCIHEEILMRLVPAFIALLLAAPMAARAGELPAKYLRASEIKRGMTGYGLSVFQGTKIERFEVEVIGLLHNAMPKQDIVLCRMAGAGLEKTGIIAGMSGSPIYLKVGNDHKLAGAVAYGWSFPKDPICGVTPFENMHAAMGPAVGRRPEAGGGAEPAVGRPPSASALDAPVLVGQRKIDDIRVTSAGSNWDRIAGGAAALYRLQTPLFVSGLTEAAFELARRDLEPLGFLPVQGGGAGPANEFPGLKLEPGSALGVRMAEGDIEMCGIGTCTEVVGNDVWGFGHPMFGEGRVSVPMATAAVQFCFPSLMRSTKFANAVQTVGELTGDMQAAVVGKVGQTARMIPIEVHLVRADMQGDETYRCRVFDHPRLTARLVGMFLANSLLVRGDLPRENTVRVKAAVHLAQREPIVIDNTYSGIASMQGLMGALDDLVGPVASLGNNEFGTVAVERITADFQVAAEATVARVESVRLERNDYQPGETLRAVATLRPHKKDPVTQTLELRIPVDFPPGVASVMVCDPMTNERLDRMEAPHRYQPRDLDHLVQILREQVSQRRLHIRMRLPDRGVAVRSVELPSLPDSMFAILASPKTTGLMLTGSSVSAGVETPFVVSGSHALPLTIRPRQMP